MKNKTTTTNLFFNPVLERTTGLKCALLSVILCATLFGSYAQIGTPASTISPDGKVQEMEIKKENFSSFPKKQNVEIDQWKQLNPQEYWSHPEFGTLPYNAPCNDCIEILDKRTVDERYFVNPNNPSEFKIQKAAGALHYQKNGRWVTIDHHLAELGNGIYEAPSQWDPVGFETANGRSYVKTPNGILYFNQWKLYGVKDGLEHVIAQADWSTFTAGEDGIYITNIFNGIDAEMEVLRGSVKTSFIIRSVNFEGYDELIFKDEMGENSSELSFKNATSLRAIDEVVLKNNGSENLEITTAVAFPDGAAKSEIELLYYQLENNRLGIVVPMSLINQYLPSRSLIIDPLVTSSNSLITASITGSMYNASCNFTNSCNYNLTVNTPANSTLTNVLWSFNYTAAGLCWLEDGAVRFTTGACISPAGAGFYWFCNLTGGGTCTGSNISIFGDLSPCLPAPSCAPVPVTFTMQFFRSCWGAAGCSNTCIGAGSPWTMTIEGQTLQYQNTVTPMTVSANTICFGQTVNASTLGQYGVGPYNYNWSFSSGGVPSVGTGANATINFPSAGAYTLYSIVTDACGQTSTSNQNITVNPSPVITAEPDLNFCAGDPIPINSFVTVPAGATFTWTNTNTSIGLAASGVGNVPAFTATNGTAAPISGTVTVTPTLAGCTGPTDNYVITVNPIPVITPEPDISFCNGAAVPLNSFVSVPAGATFNWTNSNTSIGLGASGTGSVPAFTATNGTAAAISGTITVTPSLAGCNGANDIFIITINPAPSITAEPDLVYCAGDAAALNGFVSIPAGATFTWTNSNTAIGLAASGIGSTPAFTATNGTGAPITATIVVTPTLGTCTGATDTYTITVNPSPTVTDPADQVLCTASVTTAVNFVGSVGGTTFNWTNTAPSIGLAASGSGNILPFLTVNGSAAPVVATITVTPSLGVCTGPSQNFTITVNPNPTFTLASANPSICGASDGTITISGLNASTSYTISYTDGGVPVGPAVMASNGGGAITISGLNAGTYSNFVVTLNGCSTTNLTSIILVDPNPPTVGAGIDQTICNGSSVTLSAFNPDGAVISWDNGVTNSVAFVPTSTLTYTVTANLAGCISTDQVIVTVNPNPIIGAGVDQSICAGSTVTLTAINPNSATLSWDNAVTNGVAFSPVATLTYTVTGNLAGCISTDQVVVTVNPLPTFTLASTNPTICGATDGTITISGLNPSTNYSITYTDVIPVGPTVIMSSAGGSIVLSGLNAGAYSNFIVSLLGCSTSNASVITLLDPNPPTVGAGIDQSICLGNSVTLLASNPDGAIISWDNGVTDGVSFSPATTLTYTVTANLAGCISTDQVIVTVNPNPIIGAGTDVSVCAGSTVTLTATNPNSAALTWTGGITNGVAFTPLVSGTYTVTGTLAGCVSSDAVYVTVNPIPTVNANASPATTICSGDNVTLTGSGATSYTWTGGVTNGVAFAPATTATYTVTGTTAGCTNTASITITVNNCIGPDANIGTSGSPSTICVNDCINFQDLSTGTNISTWFWDLGAGGVTSSVPNPATMCYGVPGVYTISLTVTDDIGSNTETFTLTVIDCIPPTGDFILSDTLICPNECVTLIDASLGSPTVWAWDFDGAVSPNTSSQQNPTICPTVPGSYDIELTVTNAFGTSTITYTLVVDDYPIVSAGLDTTIEMNTYAIIEANAFPAGGTFSWSDDQNIDCPTCDSTVVWPVFTEQFTVVYTSNAGCISSDSVLITVLFEDHIDVPNGFTPNGDNLNDILFVKGDGIVLMHFTIYNRYGQLVFDSFEQKIGWDGTLNGMPENPGVFVWFLEYNLVDGSSNNKKGNVTLLK